MGAIHSNFDSEAEAERKRLLAEEDRKGFLKVVVAAGVAMFAMFLVLLAILLAVGQKGMPLDHSHREVNAQLQRLAVTGQQGVNMPG